RIIEKSRERVGKERANEHRRILSLAITAQERLTKYEFAQAFDDIPLDSYIEDKIWEYCGPLIKLVGDQVVLIHYTAREFITSASTDEDLRIPEEVAHGDVAGI